MNRRGFLTALLSSAAAVAIDPERLLWVPGRKLISIPTPQIHRYGTIYVQKGIIRIGQTLLVPEYPRQGRPGNYKPMPSIVRPTIVTTDPFLFDENRELHRQSPEGEREYRERNRQALIRMGYPVHTLRQEGSSTVLTCENVAQTMTELLRLKNLG